MHSISPALSVSANLPLMCFPSLISTDYDLVFMNVQHSNIKTATWSAFSQGMWL